MGVRRMPMTWSLCPSSTTIGPSIEPWGTPLLHEVSFYETTIWLSNSTTLTFVKRKVSYIRKNNADIDKVGPFAIWPEFCEFPHELTLRTIPHVLFSPEYRLPDTLVRHISTDTNTAMINQASGKTMRHFFWTFPRFFSNVAEARSLFKLYSNLKTDLQISGGKIRVHHFIWWWEIKHLGT